MLHTNQFSSANASSAFPTTSSMNALDEQLDSDSFRYNVQYTGSIAVDTPMKSLDFETRSALAKECIHMVCVEANAVSKHRRVEPDPSILKLLALCHDIEIIGKNVNLLIGSRHLQVVDPHHSQLLLAHALHNVSFASGGEADTSDFVCYIGKDDTVNRRCYVFECGVQQASFVLTSIGTVFKNPSPCVSVDSTPPALPPRHNNPLAVTPTAATRLMLETVLERPTPENSGDSIEPPTATATSPTDEHELMRHFWYHGPLERLTAERLVVAEGDFLVRRSINTPEQLVLSGMESGVVRHLLLIDSHGQVSTKDKQFASVWHLIDYHTRNNLPITSPESSITLRRAVGRTTHAV